jgi:peroxiredoxin
MVRILLLSLLLAACESSAAPAPPAPSATVGKPAPAWDVDWMGAKPIAPADLRGKVVLVRWFTDGCSLCLDSAPTLVALDRDLAARGLQVIGMYHHKGSRPLDPARVRELATSELHFRFPIAIDREWKTLRAWWLDPQPRAFTSVSFVIDRRGVVRYIHPGGSYAPGSDDAAQLRRTIDQLLAER